ncbi:MAG: Asd/ArgC dimerization domain-containing protein [Bryobacteraceae bacterium]|nr:Asd/ArgC dimerization domain-containing protein [Bryobacteraceae bacterium]
MKKRVVLLGGDSPLGREVKERLEAAVPHASIRLTGGIPAPTEDDEEPDEVVALDAEALDNAAAVICAADAATARRAWDLAGGVPGGPVFVDLSYGLESLPEARLRSAFGAGLPPETSVQITAHPAASALALLVRRLTARYAFRNIVAQIFEPASERGTAGVTELQKQMVSLLSFKPMEKKVFDAQAAFNMLGRYGEDAPEKLEDIELRIERHLASLLAGSGPMPSLRLIQAPVFHGYTFCLWLEFETRPAIEDIEADLESEHVEVRAADVEPPSNVGAAGQGGVTTGLIEADRNNPRAVWLWAAADNYRISADSAAAAVVQILAGGE